MAIRIGVQVEPPGRRSSLHNPMANASVSAPVTKKLTDWVQPSGPMASELTG